MGRKFSTVKTLGTANACFPNLNRNLHYGSQTNDCLDNPLSHFHSFPPMHSSRDNGHPQNLCSPATAFRALSEPPPSVSLAALEKPEIFLTAEVESMSYCL